MKAGLGLLVLIFSWPLVNWGKFALKSELYSYVLLIPPICLFLAWQQKTLLGPKAPPSRALGAIFLAAGAAIVGAYEVTSIYGVRLERQDFLACMILAFVLEVVGICAYFLDRNRLRSLVFPLGLLGFMVPLPLFLERMTTDVLQHGSAAVALSTFRLLGTPVYYTNLVFKLPGIFLEVAPECSGIRSSLVLLITSLLAGFFFLRSPWKCAVLAAVAFPLALLRNGLRIVTIGELCVRIGPEMIDSDLHRRGGPLFFALSLLPLSALLWWFWRSDRRLLNSTPTY